MNVRIPSIASIETAIRIFYEYPELGSEEIQELFLEGKFFFFWFILSDNFLNG